jgi:hypothetical protein
MPPAAHAVENKKPLPKSRQRFLSSMSKDQTIARPSR